MSNDSQYLMYIGTYSSKEDKSIYSFIFDADTGDFTPLDSITGIENPSFLAIDEHNHRLYATSETWMSGSEPGGLVASLAIQPETGAFTLLNEQLTHGSFPCHLSIDDSGQYLLVANYGGGNVNLFPLLKNGEIGPMAENIQHHGQGPNLDRQEAPHPHSVFLDPTGLYAFVPDLGLDTLFVYRLDTQVSKLIPYREIKEKAGAGPRHMVFHPSGNYAYVINELDSTITAYSYDKFQADLHFLHTLSTLPADFSGESICADIHVSPSGEYLYGSNRGHDSIAVFRIDPATGQLSFVEHASTGRTPRNFALTPDGRFLVAANQDSDSLLSYTIDPTTGKLNPTGKSFTIPRPVCVKFLARS